MIGNISSNVNSNVSIAVNCSDQYLAAIPNALPANTETLDLTLNSISEAPPELLEHLTRLSELAFGGNTLRSFGVIPGRGPLNLPALRTLSLTCNSIVELGSVELLLRLERLQVPVNDLAELPVGLGATPLTKLDVSNNSRLDGFDIAALDGLQPTLRVLDVQHTATRVDGTVVLGGFRDLTTLLVSSRSCISGYFLASANFGLCTRCLPGSATAVALSLIQTFAPTVDTGGSGSGSAALAATESSGSNDSGGTCVECSPGASDHDTDPATMCVECAAGSFSSKHSTVGECQSWTVCSDHEEQAIPPTTTSDRECSSIEQTQLPSYVYVIIAVGVALLAVVGNLLAWRWYMSFQRAQHIKRLEEIVQHNLAAASSAELTAAMFDAITLHRLDLMVALVGGGADPQQLNQSGNRAHLEVMLLYSAGTVDEEQTFGALQSLYTAFFDSVTEPIGALMLGSFRVSAAHPKVGAGGRETAMVTRVLVSMAKMHWVAADGTGDTVAHRVLKSLATGGALPAAAAVPRAWVWC